MIVRSLTDRLQLITQPDHAHLARRIMERCVALHGHPRRDAILLAVGEHDNGWAEVDAAPAIDPDSGQVVDFVSAPLEIRHTVWPRAVQRLAAQPWSAALVAHHALTVYARFRAEANWSAFFDDLARLRDEQLRASGGRMDDLVADYTYVRLGDLISLVFCTDDRAEERFLDWTVSRTGADVRVSPDLFGDATLAIAVEARAIDARAYRSDADLQEALAAARPLTLRGTVGPTPGV